MSFPKARRFNEIKNVAPAPGSYDPNTQEKIPSAFLDGKDVRFKLDKDKLNLPGPGAFDMSNFSSIQTPKKVAPGFLNKDVKARKPVVDSKMKELETELKHALQERNDMSKKLQLKEEELSRLDGRLQQKNRDFSAQHASSAGLEKQLNDLKKAHQTLKQKISSNEDGATKSKETLATLKKKITDIESSKLKAEHELQALKKQAKEMKKEKETSLKMQSELKQELESLENTKTELTKTNEEKMQKQEDELKMETAQLKTAIVERVESALREAEASDEETITTLQAAKQSYEEATEKHIGSLRRTISAMKLEKFEDVNLIRHLKGEIFFIADEAQAEKMGIDRAAQKVEVLLDQIMKLEESESLLNENIQRITSKYEDVERDLIHLETESESREKQLTLQLSATQNSRSQLQTEHEQLLQRHLKLAQTLTQTHDELNEEIEQVTKEREIMTIELSLVQSSLKAMQEKNAAQTADMEELEDKNMELEVDLQTVRHRLWEVENMSREREKLMEELKAQKEKMEEQTEEISQRLQEMEEKLAQREEEVRELEEILAENLKENDERLSEEEEMTGVLKDEVDLACTDLKRLKEEQQRLMGRLNSTQSEADNLGQVNNELNVKVCQLESKVKDLEEGVEHEKEKERKVKLLLNEYEDRFEEQENVEILMAEEMREKEQEVETYKKMALDQMSVHEQMEVVLKRMKCEIEERKDNERSLRRTDAELLSKIDVLENEAEKSRDELEKVSEIKMESQMRWCQASDAEKRIGQLEADLVKMKEIVAERESQLQDFATNAFNDQKVMENNIKRCQKELVYKEEVIANMSGRCEESDVTIERLSLNIDELQSGGEEVERLKAELDEMKRAMDAYRNKAESWKEKFLELEKRAEPFKQQMEAYASERAEILGRSRDVECEMQELAQKYASLLGHQNTKQKIRHVEKLKEENIKLKQELSSVHSLNSKQKKQLAKLQDKVDNLEGKKKFDVGKAFVAVAQKENQDPPRSPLTQGNR